MRANGVCSGWSLDGTAICGSIFHPFRTNSIPVLGSNYRRGDLTTVDWEQEVLSEAPPHRPATGANPHPATSTARSNPPPPANKSGWIGCALTQAAIVEGWHVAQLRYSPSGEYQGAVTTGADAAAGYVALAQVA